MHNCERNVVFQDVRGSAAPNFPCHACPTNTKGKRESPFWKQLTSLTVEFNYQSHVCVPPPIVSHNERRNKDGRNWLAQEGEKEEEEENATTECSWGSVVEKKQGEDGGLCVCSKLCLVYDLHPVFTAPWCRSEAWRRPPDVLLWRRIQWFFCWLRNPVELVVEVG